jgi:hypothetical protein
MHGDTGVDADDEYPFAKVARGGTRPATSNKRGRVKKRELGFSAPTEATEAISLFKTAALKRRLHQIFKLSG